MLRGHEKKHMIIVNTVFTPICLGKILKNICFFIAAICSPACGNGGTCKSPGICSCRDGYTGNRCYGGKYVQNKKYWRSTNN